MQSARQVLAEQFGWNEFRPGQEAVVDALLSGHSAAAVFPTGGGKSLCYQLPALMLPGVTVVVSPLIALMKDQIDRLKQRGIAAERLDSTLSFEETSEVMRALRERRLKMLYVAPERFTNERFREAVERANVSLFAIDEAHCISEWGHNFRPDYLRLSTFAKRCRAERILALTATATPEVLEDIRRVFEIAPEHAIRTGFHRPNLHVSATPVAASERERLLIQRMKDGPAGPSIVYVTHQATSEYLAQKLSSAGFAARAYHAGLDDDVRASVQDWFLHGQQATVVATIAFGMGIDKSNIRSIYHFNLPKSLENYSQEIGRAGRDGEPARCELFVCPDDLNSLENFVYGDTPTREAVRGLLQDVLGRGPEFDVSLHELSFNYDTRPIVVRTLLTYLELEGLLEEGTPFYSTYSFKAIVPSAEILQKFEGERREFLANLFRQCRKQKTWIFIDADEAARALGATRERIVRALDFLAEQRWIELKAEGVRNRFRRLRPADDMAALEELLYARVMRREERELGRLQQMLDWATQSKCLTADLCEHFGEKLEGGCGHCARCDAGGAAPGPVARIASPISDEAWRKALNVRREHPDPLDNPRAFARFLTGLTSPRISRKRLASHGLFGSLSGVPFAKLLERAQSAT